MNELEYIRIEVTPNPLEGYPSAALQVRTKYRGQEYGAMVPLEYSPLESDFDRYMDASLNHLKEVLRSALKGETVDYWQK